MSGFTLGIWRCGISAFTGSYAAASFGDRLNKELPSTSAEEGNFDAPPLDITVNLALRLAQLWRHISGLHTWRPLTDARKLRETLQSLGCRTPDDAEIADWLASVRMLDRGPLLIRTGRAARDWINRPGVDPHDAAAMFLASCLWREKTPAPPPVSLPFWAAPEQYHRRLSLRVGVEWIAQYLECVTAAAMIGLRELARLHEAEKKAGSFGITARSRLPHALDAVIRTPIVTTGSLVKALDVTPQAALGLLRQLMAAGIVREATGRASWRAFALR